MGVIEYTVHATVGVAIDLDYLKKTLNFICSTVWLPICSNVRVASLLPSECTENTENSVYAPLIQIPI